MPSNGGDVGPPLTAKVTSSPINLIENALLDLELLLPVEPWTVLKLNKTASPNFKLGTNISFSNLQRSEVKKALIESLDNKNIEASLYWSAELVCSGHYNDIWNIIIYFIGKFINTANPKLAIYTNIRFENFKNIIINGYRENELASRNNEKIRKIIAEIICIICFSKKNYTINTINIKNYNEFYWKVEKI